MTSDNPTKSQLLIARIALVLMIGLARLGAILYGFSPEVHRRIWSDILARPGGPMTLRFLLQPVMATVAALHDGFNDARTGRSPYLWTMLTQRTERRSRFREGLIATGRTILIGLVMDTIYQATVLKTFYPGEAAIIAILLALFPTCCCVDQLPELRVGCKRILKQHRRKRGSEAWKRSLLTLHQQSELR